MRGKRGSWFGGFMVVVTTLVYSFVYSVPGSAAINQQISFQGKLVNPADGTNIANGDYSIRFRIYTSASADASSSCIPASNTCKWEDTQTISVADGVFYYALGSNVSAPLPGSVDFNTAGLYLGIKVSSDPEMTPRVQFTAAPYSFNSDKLGGIDSSGYVQIGQVSGATGQTDTSSNTSIYVNKNSGTGNILQLQKAGADVFTIDNSGTVVSTTTIQGTSLNGTVGLNTGAAGGTQRIDVDGNVVNIGNITGTAAVTLQSGGTGVLTLTSASQLSAATNSAHVVIGTGNASGSGASAGNVSLDVGTSDTGNGSILIGTAARAQTITLGNSVGGALRIGQNGGSVQIDGTNFDVSTTGVITLNGGQTSDINTAVSATTANAITVQPGSSGAATGIGAGLTLRAGDQTGATTSTGGTLVLQAGSATGAAGTRTGGNISIDAGAGATANGTIGIGAVNAAGVTIGRTGVATNMPGSLAVGETAVRNGEMLDVNGTLRSNRYILGTGPDLSLIPVANGQSVLSSWWGLQLVGNRQAVVDYTPANVGAREAYSVIVPVQQAASVGFMVRGASGQSLDLAQMQDNGGNVQAAFSSTGNQLTLGNATASGTTQGTLRLTDGTADGFYGSLRLSGAMAADQTYLLPAAGGTFCMTAACVQLGQVSGVAGQTDGSTNSSIYINKTGASGNIVQLQKAGTDVFAIDNSGAVVSTTTIQGTSLNGTVGINTGASGGTQRIDANGNLANIGNITGSAAVTLQSGGTGLLKLATTSQSTGSTNSAYISLVTGDATGTTSTAGNISIDVGTSNNGTTYGAIQIGAAAHAQTITIGNTTSGTTLNLTAAGGITANSSTTITGLASGTNTALTINDNNNANNTALRLVTYSTNTNAFEITSSQASGGVIAAFDKVGDLILGATGTAVSGGIMTPWASTASTNTQPLTITTGFSTTSGNTGDLTLQSGDATSGKAGNVTIDTGGSTTGTPAIYLGSNSTGVSTTRSITIGNTNSATVVATMVGTSTNAFSVQGASSAVYMRFDTTNNRLHVGNPSADGTAFLLVLDSKNTTGDPATGTNGALYYNSANGDYRAYQNSNWTTIQPVRYAYLTADRTRAATSYADVTDLGFTVSANTGYELVCNLIYRSAATTTGIGFALNGPSSPSLVAGQFVSNSTATALNGRSFNAYNGTGKTTGVQTANTDTYGIFRAYFRNGATAGTLQLRFSSETTTTVTVRANSFCRIAEL